MHDRPWLLIALIGAGALISWQCTTHSMRTAILITGVALALAIIRYPTVGFVVMMISFLVSASPLYQQYGFLASSYTLTDVLGVLVVGGIMLQRMRRRDSQQYSGGTARAVLLLSVGLYFAWGTLAIAWSPAPIAFVAQYIRHIVENVAILCLALLILDRKETVRWAAACYAVVTVVLALYTILIFQQLHGFDASAASATGQLSYRSGGVGDYNENELAIMIALAPCFAYLATQYLRGSLQLLLVGLTIPPVGLALIILSSREAIIAIGVAVVLALALARGTRYRFGLVALAVSAAVMYGAAAATNHIPWYFSQRFAAAGTSDFGHRLPGWQVGLQLFAQNPLAGVGTGGFQSYITSFHVNYPLVNSPHSDYVGTLADTGLIGFVFLLVMLGVLAYVMLAKSGRHPGAIMVFAILVTDMAAGSILQVHWIWVAFGIATAYSLSREGVRYKAATPRRIEAYRLHSPRSVLSPVELSYRRRLR